MQNFIVDISAPSGPLVLYAMQADSMSRFFTITVTDSGAAWTPPDGAAWTIRFGAPGMPAGWYDTITEPGGGTHPAVVVNENTATIEIAEQAISTAGKNILCVLVTDAQGYQIASWPFTLVVQGVPGLEAPEATVYYNALTAQVAETLTNAQAAANSAQAAANSASEAESFAQSINPSQFMTISQYGGSAAGVVAAADALHTARKIVLANFDGTADITVDQIGAMPKTGGSFSGPVSVNGNFSAQNLTVSGLSKLGVTRFFSQSYPNLGLEVVGDAEGGIFLALCDANGTYKGFGVNAQINKAGNPSVYYKAGGGSGSGYAFRVALGSKVITPTEGSNAATVFTSTPLKTLYGASRESLNGQKTAVLAVNGDYPTNDLRFFVAFGASGNPNTWYIRAQTNTTILPTTPVRVNYLVLTWLTA